VAAANTADPAGRRFGDDGVLYANAATDTDVLVRPVETGVETYFQLRSPDSPQRLSMPLTLPAGASASLHSDGTVSIVRDGAVIGRVLAPAALDASRADVPVALGLEGDTLTVTASPGTDAAYPVLVDPIIEYDAGAGMV